MHQEDGFGEHRLLILSELRRLNESVQMLNDKIDELTLDVVTLKVKAGLLGAVAAGVVIVIREWFFRKI
jgi:hypothetical protein